MCISFYQATVGEVPTVIQICSCVHCDGLSLLLFVEDRSKGIIEYTHVDRSLAFGWPLLAKGGGDVARRRGAADHNLADAVGYGVAV